MPRLLTTPTKLYGLVAAAAAVTAVAVPMALTAAPASASTNQISIIQEPGMLGDPGVFIPLARSLGPTTERMFIQWATVAPSPNGAKQPNFNASDPNAYPARNWAIYDQAIKAAQDGGITVDLEITGGSPRVGFREERHRRELVLRQEPLVLQLDAQRQDVRAVRACRDRALRRALQADRRFDGAAGRPLLVVLERAELRPGSRPAGDQRLDRALRAAGISGAPGRRLEGAAADATRRPQHDAGR